MASNKGRERRSCKLLGRELKLRRGHRSYAEMARLSELPPLAGRVEPVSGSYLHKLENGERTPSIDKLRTLSMLYGLTVEHMIRLIESERLADVETEGKSFEDLLEQADQAMSLGDYRTGFALALEAQETAPDEASRIAAAGTKANALWKLGMVREAASEFEELVADPAATPRQRVSFCFHLAAAFRSLENHFVAETFARRGLALVSRGAESLELAGLERLTGNLLSDRAELAEDPERTRLCREAIRHYERAEERFENLGDARKAASTRINIGVAHRIEGNTLLAFQRLREGLAACRDAENRRGVAFGTLELGIAHRGVGDAEEARRLLIDAEALAAGSGYLDFQFRALAEMIELALDEGDSPDPCLKRARALLPHLPASSPERRRFEALLAKVEGGAA